MKRASPVLAFVCLAAFDVVLVAVGAAFLVLPRAKPAPLIAAGSSPPARESSPPSGAREAAGSRAGTRQDVARRQYRPKLPPRCSEPLPERTIAGWVFEQQQGDWLPAAEAVVRLWRGRNYEVRFDAEVGDPLCMQLTQDDGAFSFGALAPGEYTLRADWRGFSGRTVFCEVEAAKDALRPPGWKFVFGDASVQGTVYDAEGAPLAGIGFIAGPEHSDGWCLSPGGETSSTGSFVLNGLPADEYVLEIGGAPGERLAWPRRRIEFALAEDQQLRLDVGADGAPAEVEGRLRDAAGAAVNAPGLRLEFRCARVAGELPIQVAIEARLEASGAFATKLEAGLWTPRLFGGTGEPLELAPVPIGEPGHALELTVAGARVRGTLRLRGTQQALDGSERMPIVGICRPGACGANVLHASTVDAQGRFEVGFLAPGDWELRVGPEWAVRQDHPLRFRLAADQKELEVEVPVERP